jgi:integrase
MRQKLTKRIIEAMIYRGDGKSRDIRWDEEQPNLGVRVYPSNKKSYVLFYRANRRQRFMTLGPCKELTLKQARDKARAHLVEVRMDNKDPLQTRKKLATGEKVKDLCQIYLDRYAKEHKKTWKEDERRLYKHIVPAWGNMKASNVTHTDVAKMHTKVGLRAKYEANRIIELVARMYTLARTWGLVPENHRNPAKNIQHYKEATRDRWVTEKELPALVMALEQEHNIYARSCIWLLLLTGARKSELLRAKWTDIDFQRSELRIAEAKSGSTRYVLLSVEALAVLETIPRVDGNPYIFVGRDEGRHLVNVNKPWNRVRQAANIEDVRLHDLRRTLGSWLAQAGNSLALIGHILGHATLATTKIYSRFGRDSAREAIDTYSTRIMGAAGKTPSAKIEELKTNLR